MFGTAARHYVRRSVGLWQREAKCMCTLFGPRPQCVFLSLADERVATVVSRVLIILNICA